MTQPLFLNQPWVDHAVCWKISNPEVWWLVDVPSDVRQVCMSCPVRSECLQYALDNNEEYGIWGGLSEKERANLKATGLRTITFIKKGTP